MEENVFGNVVRKMGAILFRPLCVNIPPTFNVWIPLKMCTIPTFGILSSQCSPSPEERMWPDIDASVVQTCIQYPVRWLSPFSLQWRHNQHDGVSKNQPYDCLLDRLFRRRSKKTSKLRVTGHCEGNSLVTGEFPAQRASNAENVSIWWRHHICNDIGRFATFKVIIFTVDDDHHQIVNNISLITRVARVFIH